MLKDLYNEENANRTRTSHAMTEGLASYKLKTVLKHLNMSMFDYDIKEDKIYIRKDSVLLHDFTPHWFADGGEYYYLENVTGRLKELVRNSFFDVTLQEIERVKQNTSGEIITFDSPIIYKGGNTRWANFVLDTVLDDEGIPVHAIGYCKDIHEQKKELYRLRNIAQTDPLTGFKNRASGTFRIQTRLTEEKDNTYFFAVIDLDKFKAANDLFGHSFGDLILKNVAERIRVFFDHETISCRTGGDEFLFFRKCEDSDQVMKILMKLKKHIEHTVSYQGSHFDVGCSIGFSLYPLQGTDFDDLYNKADMAMYHAKNTGADAPVLFEDAMYVIKN